MKKMLMSGECRIGYCGEETPLFDFHGTQLKTGDLVQLSNYSDEETLNAFYGVEYICHNTLMDSGLDERFYVMGIASQHFAYLNGVRTEDVEVAEFHESLVYQNDKEWRIVKVKDWSDVVDGEEWGVVRTVFVDESR